jgi:hypothetical protein
MNKDINFLQSRRYKPMSKNNIKPLTYGNVNKSYTNAIDINTNRQINLNQLIVNTHNAIKDTKKIVSNTIIKTNYHRQSRSTIGLIK